jgi:hypothetical protein
VCERSPRAELAFEYDPWDLHYILYECRPLIQIFTPR